MIADYDDDVKMAEAGRRAVKYKAIMSAKEIIRNTAVSLGNATMVDAIQAYKVDMNNAIDALIEALELK